MDIDPRSFVLGLAVGLGVILLLQFIGYILKPWRHAYFSGCAVPIPYILGMRFRGNQPMLLIDAYIMLRKASVETCIQEVEVLYIRNKLTASTPEKLAKVVREFVEKKAEEK